MRALPTTWPSRDSLRPFLPLAIVALGWIVMFGPVYHGLATTIWDSDANGHGPFILAVSLWLLWSRRQVLVDQATAPARWTAGALVIVVALMYVVGRSQTVWTLEVLAQNLMLAALILAFFGWGGLRRAWFPLLFLLFMVPWPGEWTDAVTQPLKLAVSIIAAELLSLLGLPVGRSGVILSLGPYKLLVADACAGLNSLFTLEALGLLYLNLMSYQSTARKVALAVLIVPISFVANVVRVVVLALVTLYFGDEAGQGFVHSFAGMLLFAVALTLILAVDGLLGRLFFRTRPHAG
ncbi:MAG: exosortase B [Rubrivivax sp.]